MLLTSTLNAPDRKNESIMATKTATNTAPATSTKAPELAWDPANYNVMGPVKLIHVDSATGALVSNFGAKDSGILSFAICYRSMAKAEGGRHPGKVGVFSAYISQKAPGENAKAKWTIQNGKGVLAMATPGMVCIGQGVETFLPHVDATVSSLRAEYAAKVAAALLAKASKAA